jgi:hypothetical protein
MIPNKYNDIVKLQGILNEFKEQRVKLTQGSKPLLGVLSLARGAFPKLKNLLSENYNKALDAYDKQDKELQETLSHITPSPGRP